MEIEKKESKRIRVNFKTSVKGIVTPDVTLEMMDADTPLVMSQLDGLYESARELALKYTELNRDVEKGD